MSEVTGPGSAEGRSPTHGKQSAEAAPGSSSGCSLPFFPWASLPSHLSHLWALRHTSQGQRALSHLSPGRTSDFQACFLGGFYLLPNFSQFPGRSWPMEVG